MKDLGILSDEEWAAYKIGTVIRGKIGRRRALQIAQQKRKIAEGHEAPEQIDVKQIVKIIHQIYACAREYWNSNKEEHSADTPPSELRQSFCVSLNDVIDDYLDELEEGEVRDPLQKSALMDHVKNIPRSKFVHTLVWFLVFGIIKLHSRGHGNIHFSRFVWIFLFRYMTN